MRGPRARVLRKRIKERPGFTTKPGAAAFLRSYVVSVRYAVTTQSPSSLSASPSFVIVIGIVVSEVADIVVLC